MKAEERHKLKTNELANWLSRAPEFGRKYGKWLLGGVVLVAVVAGVWLLVSWRSGVRRAEAWDALAEAGKGRDASARAERFAEVAKEYAGSGVVATWALYREAQAMQEQASSGRPGADEARKRAEGLYQELISKRAFDPVITPLAQMGLANLLLSGRQPDIERARELFINVQTSTKADGAIRQLAGLSANQLSNAETVTFAPPTTAPESGRYRTPGLEFSLPVAPGGSPLLPGRDGGDTGEPEKR